MTISWPACGEADHCSVKQDGFVRSLVHYMREGCVLSARGRLIPRLVQKTSIANFIGDRVACEDIAKREDVIASCGSVDVYSSRLSGGPRGTNSRYSTSSKVCFFVSHFCFPHQASPKRLTFQLKANSFSTYPNSLKLQKLAGK
jgi:hypothetical protein